jgi:LmbE family N-acetylglucosaminyl deacetylase
MTLKNISLSYFLSKFFYISYIASEIMKKNILFIVAHRDDETFGCGGTIAKLIKSNYKIFAISMTDGISSRNKPKSIEIKNRYKNSLKASKILEFEWLDKFSGNFQDNKMDNSSILDVIKVIEKVKKHVNPVFVYTHFPDDLNIDHQIVAKATMTAFRPKFRETCEEDLSI